MIANPDKIITIFARFSGATQDLTKDVEDVSVRLYKGDQHIKDLEAIELGSPLSWSATHTFNDKDPVGDYKALFEVRLKGQKDPIIEEQEITLVRDLNLISHVEIKDQPLVINDSTFEEVPRDILAYLEKKNE